MDLVKISIEKISELPGAKVNRKEFLNKILKKYCQNSDDLKLLNTKRPSALLNKDVLDHIAKNCIRNTLRNATLISAATGLPGTIAGITVGITADTAQYLYFTYKLAQQLCYIYGYEDFWDENQNSLEDNQNVLEYYTRILLGCAVNKGVGAGTNVLKQTSSKILQTQANIINAAQKAGKSAKGAGKIAVKKVAKEGAASKIAVKVLEKSRKVVSGPYKAIMGETLSREGFAKVAGKAVPILGAIVSGGITFASLKHSSKKLLTQLQEESALWESDDLPEAPAIKTR